MKKPGNLPGFSRLPKFNLYLEFLVEVARRARDVDAARDTALAVLHALDDARRLAAFRTVGRLRRVHFLLAITCFCNLGHWWDVSPFEVVSAHTRSGGRLQRRGTQLFGSQSSGATEGAQATELPSKERGQDEQDSLASVYIMPSDLNLFQLADRYRRGYQPLRLRPIRRRGWLGWGRL